MTNVYLHITRAVLYVLLTPIWFFKWLYSKPAKTQSLEQKCSQCSKAFDGWMNQSLDFSTLKNKICKSCLLAPIPKDLSGNPVYDHLETIYRVTQTRFRLIGAHIEIREKAQHGEPRELIKVFLQDLEKKENTFRYFNYKKVQRKLG